MIVVCSENEAYHAYQMFNGRWYSGRQIQCSFTSVDKWKPAICGELVISRTMLFNNSVIGYSFDVKFFKWVALLWPFCGAFCRSSLILFACIGVALPRLVNSNARKMYQPWSKRSVQHMSLPNIISGFPWSGNIYERFWTACSDKTPGCRLCDLPLVHRPLDWISVANIGALAKA